ncbi:unnamed protein product [Rotaria sordida]|uniref:Uncharacterized protein n=1 Tax=Rotaria sordida TaxID=392033 RepID=A0A819K4S2_9BILA|nr:unnamed protein product [Rotaria sordida]
MGCGTSAVSNSLNNNFHPPVAPLSSLSTLNQQSNSNRIPKEGRQIDTNEIIENFLLIWLDAEIDKSKEDYQNSIKHLRRTVNTVETFQDTEECIDCTSKLQDKKVFLIISGALCQTVVPRIHNMDQVHSIYVFYGKQENYIEWAKDWSKIKSIYTEITAICDSARQSARQCDEDSVVIAGISSLNRIEPSFMYTQINFNYLIMYSKTCCSPLDFQKQFELYFEQNDEIQTALQALSTINQLVDRAYI